MREESNEAIIGTEEGVIKVRTVRRKGTHAERWDMDQLNRIRGTPWEPQPGSGSQEIRAKIRPIRQDEPAPARIPEGVPVTRRKHTDSQ